MFRLLIVDDDVDHLKLLSTFLAMENFSVVEAFDGATAKEWLLGSTFDAVLLDWSLPDISGLELCRLFRRQDEVTPVIFVTGKTDIVNKEDGFGAGADDYLTKPFDPRELIMRVRAVLRRPKATQSELLTVSGITLNLSRHEGNVDGQPMQLTKKEFALLEIFMRNPHQILSHEMLIDLIWQNDTDKSVDVVRQTVARLRKELSRYGRGNLLRTVYGVGYRLEV